MERRPGGSASVANVDGSVDHHVRRAIEHGPEEGDRQLAREVERSEGNITSHVVLEFMRHGKKKKTVPGQADMDVRLIPDARVAATEKGKQLGAQADVAVVRGGRKRAQEAALRAALGNRPEILPEMALEEIAYMAQEQGVGASKGKKVMYDPLLDYGDGRGETLRASEEAYVGGRMTDFLVHESDDLALKENDPTFTSYTVFAGNVAELVNKYLQVGKNFSNLLNVESPSAKDPDRRQKMRDKYAKFGNQLERYLGTHIGVADSFLLKAVDKIEGRERREKVLHAMNGGAGFKELQGFRVDIENRGPDTQVVRLVADLGEEKVDLVLTPELLKELMVERDEFVSKFRREE